jgi:hypothetical protein
MGRVYIAEVLHAEQLKRVVRCPSVLVDVLPATTLATNPTRLALVKSCVDGRHLTVDD